MTDNEIREEARKTGLLVEERARIMRTAEGGAFVEAWIYVEGEEKNDCVQEV